MRPEGYIPGIDPMEFLFQARERDLVLEAQVAAVDYPNNIPTWILIFPGLDGVKGYVPASETGLPSRELVRRFVGQTVRVKVKGIDRANGIVACSRQEAVAAAATKLLPELAANPDTVLDAVVRAVLPREDGVSPRLLVDVGGGVLAEVPYAQARVYLSRPLGRQYAPGQRVRVKITRVDPQTGLVEASVRKALPDPWGGADFRRGQFVSGTVARTDGERVFIEPDIASGILGIAPRPIEGEVRRGDRVTCVVASFDREKRKLRPRLRGRLA